VIVAARDAAPTLGRTLSCLLGQDLDEPYEVVVVDDGSTDDTFRIASEFGERVIPLRLERNRGPGAARNHGVEASSAAVLAFTDSDCFPTPGWLRAGLERARGGADVVQGAVGPDPRARRTPFDRTVVVKSEVGFYPTANLFVQRALFGSLCGFRDWSLEDESVRRRPRLAPADRRRSRAARTPIGEDTLFVWRARRQGAATAFAADAVVHHAVVPGALWDEILDRWHWARDMPGMARLVPELRQSCFHRRWFFSRKTARFDAAVVALVLALLLRRGVPLAGAAPYVKWILAESQRMELGDGLRHATGSPVSDGATLLALLCGSVAWRCPVL
jgi:glycosyltransferase involved in cell wall biosynthesis